MKKFAIGCGVIVLLLGVAGVVVGYYLYRQVGSAVSQLSELSQIPEIERGISNRRAFTPPPTGDLTREQVERLVRVQTSIRSHLGNSIAKIETRYKALLTQDQSSIRDLPQLISAYRDLASTWVDAKHQQVAALNETGFSLDEYQWVREQAYTALGVPFVEFDITRAMDAVRNGQSPDEITPLKGTVEPGGSPTNRALVEGFRKQLEANIGLAALGL